MVMVRERATFVLHCFDFYISLFPLLEKERRKGDIEKVNIPQHCHTRAAFIKEIHKRSVINILIVNELFMFKV